MSISYTFNENKKGLTKNPAGTKGFAFVEFTAPTEDLRSYLKATLLRLGFQCIAQHKREEFFLSETPRVKTRGISRYKLRLPYVLHNVSYSPKT